MASDYKLWGKYRGLVFKNIDPEMRGRILVKVPDVSNDELTYAMPCVPIAGPGMGTFFLPPIGSSVWIEFEQGNPDYPIWVGCYWDRSQDIPELAYAGTPGSPNIVLQTAAQNSIVISDLPDSSGGIMLKSTSGASVIVNDTGIYIQNGKGASIVLVDSVVTISDRN